MLEIILLILQNIPLWVILHVDFFKLSLALIREKVTVRILSLLQMLCNCSAFWQLFVGVVQFRFECLLHLIPCSQTNDWRRGLMHNSNDHRWNHFTALKRCSLAAWSAFDSWGMLTRCEGECRWMRKSSRGWNSGDEGNSSWMHYLHVSVCVYVCRYCQCNLWVDFLSP